MEVAHKEDFNVWWDRNKTNKQTNCEAKNGIHAGANRSSQQHYAMDLKCVAKRFHFCKHWNKEKRRGSQSQNYFFDFNADVRVFVVFVVVSVS